MKTWKKVWIAIGALVAVVAIVAFSVQQARKGVVTVQTGKVIREDLRSTVTASGEIKPKMYVNVGANAFGKITHLFVKEGDHVKKGELLAQIENIQPEADVQATKASLQAAQTDYIAAQAAYNTAVADLARAKADDQQKRLDWQRAEGLFKDQLIAKQDYDAKRAAYEASASGLVQAKAKIAQTKAQAESAHSNIAQQRATLVRYDDVLSKTIYKAPFDGIVTNLPVREGETVVVGIQNSPGSTLMTLADNSVITAEVMVDETDIMNVKVGEPAEVTIDAIPNKVFKGTVTEIGDNALLRSTGVATSQTTASSQEAKDFKVVVTLTDPPRDLRPGLSATAKITTASKQNVLAIPIQALTIRQRIDLEPDKKKGTSDRSVEAAEPAAARKKDKEEIQGVFVVRNGKAQFVKVATGITGTTDIEVLDGLKEGDQIITGSYKVLRTLRPGASVRIDNSLPKQEDNS